jgi:hypothetical protein
MEMRIMMMKNSFQKNGNNEVVSYKNVLTGETVVSSKQPPRSKFIDGIEFIEILNPIKNTLHFMRKDCLQKIQQR